MTDEQETIFALRVLDEARCWAWDYGAPYDRNASTAAILVRALELATPGLSPELRAGLFAVEPLALEGK